MSKLALGPESDAIIALLDEKWGPRSSEWVEYFRLADASEFFYHYTSSATAIYKILATGRLRMGPLLKTNDTYETEPWQWSLII